MKKIIITIDGPAASGKEKIAKYIAKKWKLKHLDSGILYRQLALIILKKKIKYDNLFELRKIIKSKPKLSLRKTKKIRSQEVSALTSSIAVYKFIREYINRKQRQIVKINSNQRGFVIDGRDIGSVVFKKADLKLFVYVSEKNRAKRRYKQWIDSGEKSIYQKILKEIKLRDRQDKNRKHSPLVIPKGSHLIENNGSFNDTKKQINYLIRSILDGLSK